MLKEKQAFLGFCLAFLLFLGFLGFSLVFLRFLGFS